MAEISLMASTSVADDCERAGDVLRTLVSRLPALLIWCQYSMSSSTSIGSGTKLENNDGH